MLWGHGGKIDKWSHYFDIFPSYHLSFPLCSEIDLLWARFLFFVTLFSLFWFYACTAKINELAFNLWNGQFLSRLLLTCLSQPEVANVWVERIRDSPSVYDCVCFIMSSSTNGELPKQAENKWFTEKNKKWIMPFQRQIFSSGSKEFL